MNKNLSILSPKTEFQSKTVGLLTVWCGQSIIDFTEISSSVYEKPELTFSLVHDIKFQRYLKLSLQK